MVVAGVIVGYWCRAAEAARARRCVAEVVSVCVAKWRVGGASSFARRSARRLEPEEALWRGGRGRARKIGLARRLMPEEGSVCGGVDGV